MDHDLFKKVFCACLTEMTRSFIQAQQRISVRLMQKGFAGGLCPEFITKRR